MSGSHCMKIGCLCPVADLIVQHLGDELSASIQRRPTDGCMEDTCRFADPASALSSCPTPALSRASPHPRCRDYSYNVSEGTPDMVLGLEHLRTSSGCLFVIVSEVFYPDNSVYEFNILNIDSRLKLGDKSDRPSAD
nr:hypothetical protein CFP56_74423 [Quercus suber]POF23646.1 hypothetical protein CFP56_74426 [Quercus suber]